MGRAVLVVMVRKYGAATLLFFILFTGVGSPWLQELSATAAAVAVSLILVLVLSMLSAVDVRDYRLPDLFTLALTGMGLMLCVLAGVRPVWWPALSAATGLATLAGLASAYSYVRGREGIGLGDAKLFAAGGAWLGVEALPAVLLLATCSALVVVVLGALRGSQIDAHTRLPFGPFLAFAIWVVWISGSGYLLNQTTLTASG